MTFRDDLQVRLQTAFGDGYTVYEVGADVVKTPAVIINPSNPYIVPTSMGLDARISTFLDIWLVTNRSSPSDALNHLEEMRRTASQAIKSDIPQGRWTSLGSLGQTSVGGVEYATGVMPCVFVSDDNQQGV